MRDDPVFALGELGAGEALYAIDVASPSTPIVLGNFPTTSSDEVVLLDGNYLLVSGTAGLQVVTVSPNPALLTQIDFPASHPTSAVSSGTHIYVATQGDAGELVTFEIVFE